jgi:DNA-binding protein HU-beta
MNLMTLVSTVAEATGLTPKQVRSVLDGAFQTMTGSLLQGDTVRMPFGTFSVKPRAAKKGWNMHTSSPIKIPATKVVKFKAASSLKDAVASGKKKLAKKSAATKKAAAVKKAVAPKKEAATRAAPKKVAKATRKAVPAKSAGRKKVG